MLAVSRFGGRKATRRLCEPSSPRLQMRDQRRIRFAPATVVATKFLNVRTEAESVARRSSKRNGQAKASKSPNLRGCGGTSVLLLVLVYFGYLFFFLSRTWLSTTVGAAPIVFIGVLTWYYFTSARERR